MLAYEEAQRYEAELVDVVEQRDRMEGERDRARATAVALEQECDRLIGVIASMITPLAPVPTDAQPSPGSLLPGSEGFEGGLADPAAHVGHPGSVPAVSPDCFVRKHDACTGEAWDSAADALVACDCDCHQAAS